MNRRKVAGLLEEAVEDDHVQMIDEAGMGNFLLALQKHPANKMELWWIFLKMFDIPKNPEKKYFAAYIVPPCNDHKPRYNIYISIRNGT